jgi:hypothetical protein
MAYWLIHHTARISINKIIKKITKNGTKTKSTRIARVTRADFMGTAKKKAAKIRETVNRDRYPNSDWLQEAAQNALIPAEYEETARILVDPGHSAEALRAAKPLPTRAFGASIFSMPSVKTVPITVAAGETKILFTHPEPSVAFITTEESGGIPYFRAYATSHALAASPTQPGGHMQRRSYSGVRCTAKSLTVENVTPQLSRGGYCLTRRMNQITTVTNINTVPGAVADMTVLANRRYTGDMPISLADFQQGQVYETYGPEGAYVVAAPVRNTFDMLDNITKEVPYGYTGTQPADLSLWGSSAIQLNSSHAGASSYGLYWGSDQFDISGKSNYVFATALHDGMTVEAIALTAPASSAQTFSVKFHARYEYLVEPHAPDFAKAIATEADTETLDAIIHFASLMPGSYPASYNNLGKVWRAFKKGVSWVARNLLLPGAKVALTKTAPIITRKFGEVVAAATH